MLVEPPAAAPDRQPRCREERQNSVTGPNGAGEGASFKEGPSCSSSVGSAANGLSSRAAR
jgi:hypothetical protein